MGSCFEQKVINDVKGRGLVATKDINAGDIIFTEKPLVSCQFAWNAAYNYLACDHCMRPLETVQENAVRLTGNDHLIVPYQEHCATVKNIVRCRDCQVQYCSTNCQVEAYELYHRTLCHSTANSNAAHPLEQLIETWKQIEYPPETCNIMLLMRIFATIYQSADTLATTEKFTQFAHQNTSDEIKYTHKVFGEQYDEYLDTLREQVIQSLPADWTDERWLTKDGFRTLLVVVGTNGQGLGTSPLTVWYRNCEKYLETCGGRGDDAQQEQFELFVDNLYEDIEKHSGEFVDSEGSGMYALQSRCNHSCDPNAQCSFPNNNFELALKATKDIRCGEEITISYVTNCVLNRSARSRKQFLSENYLFQCQCEKCELQGDDCSVSSDEESEDNMEQ